MNPKIVVIGAVSSTKTTIQCLVRHGFDLVGVLGHEPKVVQKVSGWVDLRSIAHDYDLPFFGFQQVNQDDAYQWACEKQPDLIFAVGFSQLLHKRWLNLPTLGCVGFHPTRLPRGRGRAPLAWIILEERCGAATFFLMGEGADDGPIFVQEPFRVEEFDDAKCISDRINDSISIALDRWLPDLKLGLWNPRPQDDAMASYYGVRRPDDGLIEWEATASSIDRLIKATSYPHPGAYTYHDGIKIIVWSSEIETKMVIRGVVGRIVLERDGRFLVQCGDGLLWLSRIEGSNTIKVGDKLGFTVQDEIKKLWDSIGELRHG